MKAKYLVLKYYCKIKIKRGIAMKFVKIDKEKFKPTKNSVKELIFLAYLSFILFICTEVMSAMGTTSYGYIEKFGSILYNSFIHIFYNNPMLIYLFFIIIVHNFYFICYLL